MKILLCVQKVKAFSGENFVLEGGLWESPILGCSRGGEDPTVSSEGPRMSWGGSTDLEF